MSIQEKRARFNKVLGTLNVLDHLESSLVVTSGMDVIYVNQALLTSVGLPSTYEVNHFGGILPYVHEDDHAYLVSRMRERSQGKKINESFKLRLRHKNGSIRYIKASTSEIIHEGTQFVLTTFLDITGEAIGSQSLTNTLDAMHVGLALLDEHKILFANQRLIRVLPDFPRAEEKIDDFLTKHFSEKDTAAILQLIASDPHEDERKSPELELAILNPRHEDGDEKVEWLRFKRLQNVLFNGVNAAAISVEDVSQRKLAEYEAERANSLFRSIQEPAVIANFDGFFTKVNPAFEKLLEYSAEELMSQPYINFIAEEDHQFTIAGNPRFLKGNPSSITSENTYITKSGERIILNWSAVPDYDKKLLYATARNVTRERNYEQHILNSEAELKRTLRIAQLGSWNMTGFSGEENWNYETRLIFDVGPDHEPKIRRFIVNKDIERFNQRVRECFQTRADFDDVFEIRTIKKARKYIRIISEFDAREGGSIKGIIQDVTPVREAELKMLEALEMAEEAARLKSEFLSVMSHEIRTPMNAVIGMAHLLMENDPREDQIDEIQTLQFAANNLLALINDILDFSKAEAGRLQLVEENFKLDNFLDKLVRSFEPMAQMKDIELDLILKDKLSFEVFADRTRLTQILNNLIGNAVKFTEKGKVSVFAKIDHIDADKQTAFVRIHIQDTGIGIPENKLDSIFESFTLASTDTSRKYGGTGLGLAISKRLIQLFNGSIDVASEEGKGTTFSLLVPLKIHEKTLEKVLPELAKEKNSEPISSKRLLVVDDNRVNLKIVRKFLSKWNIDADYVESGPEALKNLANGEYYHLVLMDIQMPEMDGYETTRQILSKKEDPLYDLPIIALTAEVIGGVRDKVLECGMLDMIAKPFNPQSLQDKIQTYAR